MFQHIRSVVFYESQIGHRLIVSDEFERILEEVVTYFKTLFQHLPGKTEETHVKPLSGQCVLLRFKPETYVIQRRRGNHYTLKFSV
jgi:hypothetical protein